MAIVINDPYARGGGAVAGQEFGNLLSSGLQQLANHKMSQLQARHQSAKQTKAFEGLGLSPQMSQALAALSPEQQNLVLKNFGENFGFGSGQQQSPQQQFASPQEQQQPMQSQQFNPMQQEQPQQPQQGNQIENLMRSIGAMPQNPLDQLSRQSLGSQVPTQQVQGRQALLQPQVKSEGKPAAFVEQTRDKILSTRPVNKFQQSLYKEAKKAEIKQQHAEMKETSKENKKFIQETYETAKETRENEMRLDRLEKLTKSGNLSRPRFYGLLDTLAHGVFGHGVNLKSFLTPETEEFDKVSKEMIKGAKSIFGSRITDNDLKQFMQMIPNAAQSREGKLRVIHQMKLFNEGNIIRKQAMDEIIRENRGVAPKDLKHLVEDRIQPKLNEIAKRYEAGLQGPREKPKGFLDEPELYGPLDALLGKG